MEERTKKASAPTYEQLEKEIAGLKGMNNQLMAQLQNMNMSNLFKRLDYLFKVMESREALNPEFVNMCAEEIMFHMTPVAQKDNNQESQE